jgi:hypothetical protein
VGELRNELFRLRRLFQLNMYETSHTPVGSTSQKSNLHTHFAQTLYTSHLLDGDPHTRFQEPVIACSARIYRPDSILPGSTYTPIRYHRFPELIAGTLEHVNAETQ